MKIRIVLASAVVAGAFSLTAIAISGVLSKEPVPPAIAEATLWTPDSLSEPQIVETNSVRSFFVQADDEFRFAPLLPLPVALADAPMPSIEPLARAIDSSMPATPTIVA